MEEYDKKRVNSDDLHATISMDEESLNLRRISPWWPKLPQSLLAACTHPERCNTRRSAPTPTSPIEYSITLPQIEIDLRQEETTEEHQ